MRKLIFFLLLITIDLSARPINENTQVFFSKEESIAKEIIGMINKEEKSIKAAIYSFTHRDIINALIDAKKRGVDIEVIVDPTSVKDSSPLKKLVDAGVAVLVWDPTGKQRFTKYKMHNKFCVFGKSRVLSGSYNFSYSADKFHQENILVIDNEKLADEYLKEFVSIKEQCCLYSKYLIAQLKPK